MPPTSSVANFISTFLPWICVSNSPILVSVLVILKPDFSSSCWRKSSAKSNHASVVKYIVAEDAKCTVGTSKVFGVDLDNDTASVLGTSFNCTDRTASEIAQFAEAALSEFKNPYYNSELAVNDDGTATDKDSAIAEAGAEGQEGYVIMSADDTNDKIYIATCHAKKCDEKDGSGNFKNVSANELDVAE